MEKLLRLEVLAFTSGCLQGSVLKSSYPWKDQYLSLGSQDQILGSFNFSIWRWCLFESPQVYLFFRSPIPQYFNQRECTSASREITSTYVFWCADYECKGENTRIFVFYEETLEKPMKIMLFAFVSVNTENFRSLYNKSCRSCWNTYFWFMDFCSTSDSFRVNYECSF